MDYNVLIDKFNKLDNLLEQVADEKLREEISNAFFELLTHYGEDKLKEDFISGGLASHYTA